SAIASKVLQRPSGAMKPTLESEIIRLSVTINETPPAIVRSHSPRRRLWQARWMATSEDEQAVSMETLGPRKSSRYDRRFANTLWTVPVSVRASIESGSWYDSCA